MFEISFPELMLAALVTLMVLGPDRLPAALRTVGLWIGRARRSFVAVKNEIEKEIGMDDVRRQLHNESVIEEMQRIEREVRDAAKDTAAAASAGAEALKDEPVDADGLDGGDLKQDGTDADAMQGIEATDASTTNTIAPPGTTEPTKTGTTTTEIAQDTQAQR